MASENNSSQLWLKTFLNDYLSFDSQYALEILHSLGFVFDEKYSTNIALRKRMMELAKQDDKRFYELAVKAYHKLKKDKSLKLETIFNKKKIDKISTRPQKKDNSYYVAVIHVTSNSTCIMPRIWIDGNRALRHRISNNNINDFCLVYLKSNSSTSFVNNCDYFKKVFLSGIEICNIRYHFIGSSNSQLKKNSYWFVKAETLDDVDKKRNQLGDFSHISNVGKYIARVGLWFSTSIPTAITLKYVVNTTGEFDQQIRKGEICVTTINDVERNEYCFTDGNGLISKGLARRIAEKLGYLIKIQQEEIYPSAYQIRMAGCKGLVIIDPHSTLEQYYIKIRPSMKKFDCDEWILEISDRSRPIPTRLNNQIILLMSDLGVPDSTFEDFQSRWFDNKQQASHHKDHLLKNKIPMPVNECRYMFGCALECKLESNQCFIRYQIVDNDHGKPSKIPKFKTVIGEVIVTKNPCPYAGDMLTLQAVDRPELHCLQDVIVFSTQGDRPTCNQIGGSDLDGDQYFVYWGSELRLLRKVPPLDYKSPSTNDCLLSKPISSLDFINECLSMLGSSIYGEVYNLMQIIVDKNEEKCEQRTCQTKAKEMAQMFSIAIDSCKTGCSIDQTYLAHIRDICGTKYPDFLMKKPSYQSQSILGKLYRTALEFINEHKDISNCATTKIKQKENRKRIQNGENNLPTVDCDECGKTCKNDVGLAIHKRTCGEKKGVVHLKIASTVEPTANMINLPTTTGEKGFRIIDRLTKNSDGKYNCPNEQCGKIFHSRGITQHVKSCAKEWLKQNGFSID